MSRRRRRRIHRFTRVGASVTALVAVAVGGLVTGASSTLDTRPTPGPTPAADVDTVCRLGERSIQDRPDGQSDVESIEVRECITRAKVGEPDHFGVVASISDPLTNMRTK